MKRRAAFICVVFMTLAAAARACAVEVNASLDKQKAVIGEPVVYSLVVSGEEGFQIQPPDLKGRLGNFTITDFNRTGKSRKGLRKITLAYTLKSFSAGEQTIPQVVLSYRRSPEGPWLQTTAGPLRLTVESALEPQQSKWKLRDIKGPVALERWRGWLAVFLLLAAAAALAAWWYKTRKPEDPLTRKPANPPVPAHQIALAALAALKQKEYVRQGLVKLYFVELSGIVRRYLEDRFSLHAPEMTTEEFLARAGGEPVLSQAHKESLKEFLERSDLVKFAKYAASPAECDTVFEAALNFVEQTKEEIREQN